jgi:hypothetical protein
MTDREPPTPEERAAIELLERHRPVADPELRRRGRGVIAAATTRLHWRHQAQLLLATGWTALLLAAAVAFVG